MSDWLNTSKTIHRSRGGMNRIAAMTPEQRAASRAAWRARVPWTDIEVRAALCAERIAVPGSYFAIDNAIYCLDLYGLTISVLSLALPSLVKTCALCGKTALYRYGNEGRCRAHHTIKPGWHHTREHRLAERDAAFQARDRLLTAVERHKARFRLSAAGTKRHRK